VTFLGYGRKSLEIRQLSVRSKRIEWKLYFGTAGRIVSFVLRSVCHFDLALSPIIRERLKFRDVHTLKASPYPVTQGGNDG
jgi:hypothetical protein